jgi:hypothetical protein
MEAEYRKPSYSHDVIMTARRVSRVSFPPCFSDVTSQFSPGWCSTKVYLKAVI